MKISEIFQCGGGGEGEKGILSQWWSDKNATLLCIVTEWKKIIKIFRGYCFDFWLFWLWLIELDLF